MKNRCHYIPNPNYKYYGAKGIRVCDEWLDDYTEFKSWAIQNGYKHGLQLDRKDNSKGYSPGNCRFISQTENLRNASPVVLNESDVKAIKKLKPKWESGKIKQTDIARIYGVTKHTIYHIFKGKRWADI